MCLSRPAMNWICIYPPFLSRDDPCNNSSVMIMIDILPRISTSGSPLLSGRCPGAPGPDWLASHVARVMGPDRHDSVIVSVSIRSRYMAKSIIGALGPFGGSRPSVAFFTPVYLSCFPFIHCPYLRDTMEFSLDEVFYSWALSFVSFNCGLLVGACYGLRAVSGSPRRSVYISPISGYY